MADRRDPRFGGNMEVANTGIPYPTGGRDVRFDPSLPPQFQYRDRGRTVVSGNEPAFTDMGRNRSAPLFNQMGAMDGFGTPNFFQPTGRPNFRAPSGMGGGIMGALPGEYETSGLYQTWKKIYGKFGETFANDWLAKQQAV